MRAMNIRVMRLVAVVWITAAPLLWVWWRTAPRSAVVAYATVAEVQRRAVGTLFAVHNQRQRRRHHAMVRRPVVSDNGDVSMIETSALVVTDPKNDTNSNGNNTNSSYHSNDSSCYTLEYSPNFNRHVVRNANGTVVQSFLWLDEAVRRYPTVTLLPLVVVVPGPGEFAVGYTDSSSSRTSSSTSTSSSSSTSSRTLVAGGGVSHVVAYPPASPLRCAVTVQSNRAHVGEILQSLLKWYPTQVERLLERLPPLRFYPPHLLQERLEFLLAPLPLSSDTTTGTTGTANILEQVNVTDDIDWPCLFHRYGCGAGMTVGQVSHALQVLPEPLLLRLDSTTFDCNSSRNSTETSMDNNNWDVSVDYERPKIPRSTTVAESVAQLYEETPPLVMQMTLKVLHLWVTGVTHMDVLSLAYLHWRGWEWQACRIVIHAFRSSLTSSVEVVSGIRHCTTDGGGGRRGGDSSSSSSSSSNRNALLPQSLVYLQARLQIRPWHIHAMLHTHSRLAGYTPTMLCRKLDFLQERLQLTSAQLQAIVLVMPSLLGAGIPSLEIRIDFWTNQVGLTLAQLRNVVTQKPSLLQYSIKDNLSPKFEFLVVDLGLAACEASAPLVRMTCANPELWGRSLERFLRPMAKGICAELDHNMSLLEFGQLVSKLPQLLRYSVSNLVSKLIVLKTRLGLTSSELTSMVQSSPRLLLQSVETSLEPKIDLAESFGAGMYRDAIRDNPSLLLLSKTALKQRLEHAMSHSSLATASSHRLRKSARTRKAVWLLSIANETEVELEFSEVAAAAAYAGTSQSNMYLILRLHRLLKGRRFVYAAEHLPPLSLPPLQTTLDDASVANSLLHDTDQGETSSAHLTIHTAGCAFPPENTVRGRRRSGGMALQIRNWSTVEWRETCSQMWTGLRLRLLSDSQTLILGYPFSRPSRPRCSLYACHEALRVSAQWLSRIKDDKNVTITIVCECNYVCELLQNTSQVAEWGRAESKAAFSYSGPGLLHQANPDILYPLSRQVFLLCGDGRPVVPVSKRTVCVRFIASDECERSRRIRDGAKLAAKLMYDSER